MPDITQNLLLAEIDETDLTVYPTSNIFPSANKLIIALVGAVDFGFSGPILVNTITGAGLTWVKIDEVQLDTIAGPRQTMAAFRALGPSPSAGSLTITMDGPAALAHWIITEFGNVDTGGIDGADAVVQSAKNVADSGASIIATLAAFGDVENATVGCFASGADPAATWTPGAGFIEIAEATGAERVPMMEFRADNDVSVDATQSDTKALAVIGLELKVAPPPPPVSLIAGRPAFIRGNLIT